MKKCFIKLLWDRNDDKRLLICSGNREWIIDYICTDIVSVKQNFFKNFFINVQIVDIYTNAKNHHFLNFIITQIFKNILPSVKGKNISIHVKTLTKNFNTIEQDIIDSIRVLWEVGMFIKLWNKNYKLITKINALSNGFLVVITHNKKLVCMESYNYILTKNEILEHIIDITSTLNSNNYQKYSTMTWTQKEVEEVILFDSFTAWAIENNILKENILDFDNARFKFLKHININSFSNSNSREHKDYNITSILKNKLYHNKFLDLLFRINNSNYRHNIKYIFNIDSRKSFIRRNNYKNKLLNLLFSNIKKNIEIRVLNSERLEDGIMFDLLNQYVEETERVSCFSCSLHNNMIVENPHVNLIILSDCYIKWYKKNNFYVCISIENKNLLPLNKKMFINILQ